LDPLQDEQPDSTTASETIAAPLRERPRPDRQIVPEQFTAMHLEVVGGPMDGVTTHVAKDALTIGRDPRADLSLRLDPMVSTNHARIVRDGKTFWLEDLDSRNGTYIGEQRIQGRSAIGPGTLFVLGSTCLEFMPV
jgi:pSer/pThr/pTyr-binding forkhead associated (FHA) protein